MLAKRRRMDMQCDPQWVLDLFAERDELRALLKRMFVAFDTDGANPDPVMDELRAMLGKESV